MYLFQIGFHVSFYLGLLLYFTRRYKNLWCVLIVFSFETLQCLRYDFGQSYFYKSFCLWLKYILLVVFITPAMSLNDIIFSLILCLIIGCLFFFIRPYYTREVFSSFWIGMIKFCSTFCYCVLYFLVVYSLKILSLYSTIMSPIFNFYFLLLRFTSEWSSLCSRLVCLHYGILFVFYFLFLKLFSFSYFLKLSITVVYGFTL